MRIALVHSFYSSRQPSGENTAVQSQAAALIRAGHDVRLFGAHTDELGGALDYRLRSGIRVASGRGNSPLAALNMFQPDCVHIHNLFPNYSRHWVEKLDVPIVLTLHNYRALCANGLLFRDGHTCTLCPEGNRWAGVQYACYRDSRVATLPLAWANRHGPAHDPVVQAATAVVVLSDKQRSIFADSGIPRDKLVVVPNFLPVDLEPARQFEANPDRDGWLFVGRLSEEKGILELLETWPENARLTVIGDGPLRDRVRIICERRNISFLGRLTREEVLTFMSSSVGLTIPSRCFEACPLVYLEALSVGLPVLAWEPSGVADLVRQDGAGWVQDETSNLSSVVTQRWEPGVGLRARSAFETNYSESVFLERLPLPTS